jgi:adenylate cyclase, class 2
VNKKRHLFLWEGNVRIHLDHVEGLGNFIELEATVVADSDSSRQKGQIRTLRETFDINDSDLIGISYGDLAQVVDPEQSP